jgi:hypothetical protein
MIRNPEEIQITIETGIQGKESFLLTSDLLYQPGMNKPDLSKFPFITNQIKYPIEMIKNINRYGYEKIISFFFKKDYFKNKLGQYYSPDLEKNQPNKNDNLEYNVNIMLQYLFQTKFPFKNNYTDSFHEYILKEDSKNLIMRNAVYSYPKSTYSYLKINNVVYTVLKATLLNDLINNPVYRTFINDYIEFNEWRNTEIGKTKGIIYEKYEILLRRLTNDTIYFANDEIMEVFYDTASSTTTTTTTPPTTPPTKSLDESFQIVPTKEFKDILKNLSAYFETTTTTAPVIDESKGKIKDEIDNIIPKPLDEEGVKDELITLFEEQKKIFEDSIEKDKIKDDDKVYIKNLEDFIKILKKIKEKGKEKIQSLSLILLNGKITKFAPVVTATTPEIVDLIGIFDDNRKRLDSLTNIREKDAILDNLYSLAAELEKNKKIFEEIQLNDIKTSPNINGLNDNMHVRLKSLYDNYVEIDKYYKKISATSFSLKYIPSDFSKNLSKCLNEVKTLLNQDRIRVHIEAGDLNLRLEEDEKEFIGDIEKNYPVYKKFIDKVKYITTLESTNIELQKKIMKYYKSNDKTFTNLLDSINKKTITSSQKKEINTGVFIVKEKENKHYSVYVALNLAEIEINDKNKYGIKCIYRSLYIGSMVQNTYKNQYDEKNYRMLIKNKYIKDNLNSDLKSNPDSTKTSKGGTTTKKFYKSKSNNKTRRNLF